MISFVVATFNRAHLLRRSLECYKRQTDQDFELVVVDDDSSDGTYELCREAQKEMNLVYIALRHPADIQWRDAAAVINLGIRAAKGKFVLITHPEVMPCFSATEILAAESVDDTYVCFRPYYLSYKLQEAIDTVNWSEQGIRALRMLPGFYGQPAPGPGYPDYRPEAIERSTQWDSWVFGGLTKSTWKRIGGVDETNYWGTQDIGFLSRRHVLGIRNKTVIGDDTYCVHQNHDSGADIQSPRDMALCMKNVRPYTAETAILHNV